MKLTDEWFTAVAESEEGKDTIFVSGRYDIDLFRESGKFRERVEITWRYAADTLGMPDEPTAAVMEQAKEAIKKTVEKNKLAILTGVYTGGGERNMVFYTRNVPAFGEALNDALSGFEMLPITIYTEKDEAWSEYAEMCELRAFDVNEEG